MIFFQLNVQQKCRLVFQLVRYLRSRGLRLPDEPQQGRNWCVSNNAQWGLRALHPERRVTSTASRFFHGHPPVCVIHGLTNADTGARQSSIEFFSAKSNTLSNFLFADSLAPVYTSHGSETTIVEHLKTSQLSCSHRPRLTVMHQDSSFYSLIHMSFEIHRYAEKLNRNSEARALDLAVALKSKLTQLSRNVKRSRNLSTSLWVRNATLSDCTSRSMVLHFGGERHTLRDGLNLVSFSEKTCDFFSSKTRWCGLPLGLNSAITCTEINSFNSSGSSSLSSSDLSPYSIHMVPGLEPHDNYTRTVQPGAAIPPATNNPTGTGNKCPSPPGTDTDNFYLSQTEYVSHTDVADRANHWNSDHAFSIPQSAGQHSVPSCQCAVVAAAAAATYARSCLYHGVAMAAANGSYVPSVNPDNHAFSLTSPPLYSSRTGGIYSPLSACVNDTKLRSKSACFSNPFPGSPTQMFSQPHTAACMFGLGSTTDPTAVPYQAHSYHATTPSVYAQAAVVAAAAAAQKHAQYFQGIYARNKLGKTLTGFSFELSGKPNTPPKSEHIRLLRRENSVMFSMRCCSSGNTLASHVRCSEFRSRDGQRCVPLMSHNKSQTRVQWFPFWCGLTRTTAPEQESDCSTES
ncbi:hypothetical protein CSKR_109031 [Clonorchis sinensis]|uniref:Uncharacterized protein n=1 Tax=Clonorchis sinensis TaxID=79923 RepID=A0A419Q4D8_CLOSI|nr:hypothetical protein CSKR_109031 [Clonorchis sinensis]